MIFLAHGIGGVQDLPVPKSFFYASAAIVLVVSFVLLGVLWGRPQLERRAGGRPVPGGLDRIVRSMALRIVLGAASVAVLFVTLWAEFFGTTIPSENFAPTFIYVAFWLGLPLLSVLFGNVWRVLSPWRAIADASVWVLERGGRRARPFFEYPEGLGRYPAAGALFAFVALELASSNPADPHSLGIATALYTYWALAGMAVFGREAWTKGGEGFAVEFAFLARMAPFAGRDGRAVFRWPFTGLGGADRMKGTLAVIAVMLGSTSFDGFSRTPTWQNRINAIRTGLADAPGWRVNLTISLVNIAGLVLFVGLVALTYILAVTIARRLVHTPRSLVPEFLLSLVPIAAAYFVAHYFSLFVIQGQYLILLVSDPLGRGWDLFGTAGFVPDTTIVSTNTIWYVEVGALVIGHVAGLAVAHDRAVSLFDRREDALRSQYPMLALMVLFTLGGLWILSH